MNHSLTWRKVDGGFPRNAVTSSTLFIIAIGASLLTRFLAVSGAGNYLSELISFAGDNPYLLLMIITLIYLVLGMFLEPIGAMLLNGPDPTPGSRASWLQSDLVWSTSRQVFGNRNDYATYRHECFCYQRCSW